MDKNIAKKQVLRKRRRELIQKKKRNRNFIIGVLAVVGFAFLIKPVIIDDKSASADSARILHDSNITMREYSSKGSQIQRIEDTNHQKNYSQGFSDSLLSYMQAKKDLSLYKEKDSNEIVIMKVDKDSYLEFYGVEGDRALVEFNNSKGYVNFSDLSDLPDKYLTVKEGQLYVSKDNIIPEDFTTKFDIDAENALLTAFGAMKRDGIKLEIGRTYTSFEDEANYITNKDSDYSYPDSYTSELRSGLAIEVYSPKTDPRIDKDFFSSEEGHWVKENLYKYGFIQRYPEGKEDVTGFAGNQHIYRYVGVEIAKEMYENKQTMEEYFNK